MVLDPPRHTFFVMLSLQIQTFLLLQTSLPVTIWNTWTNVLTYIAFVSTLGTASPRSWNSMLQTPSPRHSSYETRQRSLVTFLFVLSCMRTLPLEKAALLKLVFGALNCYTVMLVSLRGRVLSFRDAAAVSEDAASATASFASSARWVRPLYYKPMCPTI